LCKYCAISRSSKRSIALYPHHRKHSTPNTPRLKRRTRYQLILYPHIWTGNPTRVNITGTLPLSRNIRNQRHWQNCDRTSPPPTNSASIWICNLAKFGHIPNSRNYPEKPN
jgi:hypothetical protein